MKRALPPGLAPTLKLWPVIVITLAAAALLRFAVPGPGVLTAAEADTLEASVVLAHALTDDAAPDGERLKIGFATWEDHPKLGPFPAEQVNRRAVIEPPVPKWLGAASIMLAPASDETPNASRTRTGATLAVALALALLLAAWWRGALPGHRDRLDPWRAVVAAVVLLLLPGVVDASASAGYGASAIFTMALLVVAVRHLCGRWRAWPAALAWGLTLGVHPGALALVIPIFVAYAIANRAAPASSAVAGPAMIAPSAPADAGQPGLTGVAPMPWAPLGLYVLPVAGLAVLVAIWPALWESTGERLMAWIIDTWWYFNPSYDVAGMTWLQAANRAAPAWTALAQWLAATPLPLVLAFALGVAADVRAGRAADWFPLLAWLTLILVGAGDGSLHGGRLSLLPLLWVPTAWVAARGVAAVGDVVAARWPRMGAGRALALVAAVTLALPVVGAFTGLPFSPAGGVGAELARPVPVGLLERIAAEDPGAGVHIAPEPREWRPAIQVARSQLELAIGWAEAGAADWIVVAPARDGPAPPPVPPDAGEPVWRGQAMGVPMAVYRVVR